MDPLRKAEIQQQALSDLDELWNLIRLTYPDLLQMLQEEWEEMLGRPPHEAIEALEALQREEEAS